ncbi:cytosine permease [Miniphocaeibacter massiliensis]|uniref:cytosine permease n=1 Tax=Miniphocaeibacter massiliensis TaxID=2041841 RepID=UPI000C1C8088|nr:cytosine permease [Miniphocaeibacter massiliensis]
MSKKYDMQTTVNDFATERVPLDQRKSMINVAIIASGFCISMSGLFTGAAMAESLNIKEAFISAIVGNLILTVIGGFGGIIGTREGLTSSRLAMFSFGKQGFKLVSLVLALTMGGWFSVQAGLFGNTINAMLPNAGIISRPAIASFWGAILMMLTAIVGIKGLSILSKIAVPAIAICATIGVFAAVNSVGGWSEMLKVSPSKSFGISTGIVLVVGSFAAGASAQADISRYSTTSKASLLATTIGYIIANTFIILAGYLTTLATGIGDLPKAMIMLGLGVPALLVLVLAQWTTNDNNLYTSSLGLANIIPVNRSYIAIAIGVIGAILGAVGVANNFTNWLELLGIGIPPMAGVIICDYYFINSMNYSDKKLSELKNWNWKAIVAWILGIVVGFGVKLGIASLNSLATALISYFILMKIKGEKQVEKEEENGKKNGNGIDKNSL